MMCASVVFVSGGKWSDYVANGFRTRQGALLKTFASLGLNDHVSLFVETGFRGSYGVRKVHSGEFASEITEIMVPGWLPEIMLRPLGSSWLQVNYRIPPEAVALLRAQPPALIWSYSAGLGAVLQKAIPVPAFYDVVDYRGMDANLSAWQRHLWRRELQAGCSYADVVVCNGEVAHRELSRYAMNRCVLLRNGVDPGRFVGYRDQAQRRGVGFIGVISKWIDFGLLELLLARMPRVSFEFHGIIRSAEARLQRLMRYPNFRWHGELPPREVPAFLGQCQVGIIPYDPQMTWYTLGDSMKAFEYLAAGTPLVSTAFQPGLEEKFCGLIEVCDSHGQFVSAVRRLIEQPPSQDWRERAWSFVLANSWHARLEEIVELVRKNR